MKEPDKKFSALKIVIIVLLILLLISLGLLLGKYIYFKYFDAEPSSTVSGNVLGETTTAPTQPGTEMDEKDNVVSQKASSAADYETELKLYRNNGLVVDGFEVHNMLPGDKEIYRYKLTIYNRLDTNLYFSCIIEEQTKALGDVLRIRVTHEQSNRVLVDDTFSNVDGKEFAIPLRQNTDNQTAADYIIEVYTDTSVGNSFQQAMLKANFQWQIKDSDALVVPATAGADSIPNTAVIISLVSALLIVLLLLKRRAKEDCDE